MNLEKLKKIAEAKTKGEWAWENSSTKDEHCPTIILCDNGVLIEDYLDSDDAKFIAAFANHAEALLDVVEAAKRIPNCKFEEAQIAVWKLEEALEKLEAL